MKKKMMQIGYVLVVVGLIVGGVYNICTAHPVLSQYYTKIFSKETKAEYQNKTKTKTSTDASLVKKETGTQQAIDNTETNHVHTWKNDMEWIWIGNEDGTGHVEKVIVEKCECGEYKTN